MEGFYTPEDIWRLSEEVKVMRAEQVEHARQLGQHSDRLSRLERRGDDTGIRSLWTSCFPPVQTGPNFPQLNPGFQTDNSLETFDGFDSQQQHALVAGLAGLPLDEVDVPRRGASRANSVRFDDTTIQSHWTPDSHISNEYFPHCTNSIGGHPMTERSSSFKSDYKSEGRQSSVRSMRSFDNYSIVDSKAGVPQQSSRSVLECNDTTEPATPPVIRCWLGKAFSCESILYALICTGSSKSLIDKSLVSRSGLSEMVWQENGQNRVSLSLYLADALVPPERIASSNTLPRLKGEFIVIDLPETAETLNAVGIVLGSDILSAIQADVMFSKSQMSFLVTDGRTVQVDFAQLGPEMQYPSFCMMDSIQNSHIEVIQQSTIFQQPSRGSLGDRVIDLCGTSAAEDPHNIPSNEGTESKQGETENSQQLESVIATTIRTSDGPLENLGETLQSASISDESPASDGKTSRFAERPRSKSYGDLNGQQNSSAAGGSWAKNTGRNIWESWRKSSDGIIMQKTTSEGGSSKKPARPMKVLRTSKSAASSVSGNQSKGENRSPKPVFSAKLTSPSKINGTKSLSFSRQQGQPSSVSNSSRPGPAKSRSSTNVVGSASAFHWMNQNYH